MTDESANKGVDVTVGLTGVAALMSSGSTIAATATVHPLLPAVVLGALLIPAGSVADGTLIQCIAPPWFAIMELIRRDPEAIYRIDPRQWEEIVAGAYHKAGFNEVVLTPRSGDHGRDVIATKTGVGSVRFYDQVKAFKPGHLVTANDVRALAGTLQGNVSKGILTTTSDFAPRILDDPIMSSLIPHRLELKPRSVLLPWLDEVARKPG